MVDCIHHHATSERFKAPLVNLYLHNMSILNCLSTVISTYCLHKLDMLLLYFLVSILAAKLSDTLRALLIITYNMPFWRCSSKVNLVPPLTYLSTYYLHNKYHNLDHACDIFSELL